MAQSGNLNQAKSQFITNVEAHYYHTVGVSQRIDISITPYMSKSVENIRKLWSHSYNTRHKESVDSTDEYCDADSGINAHDTTIISNKEDNQIRNEINLKNKNKTDKGINIELENKEISNEKALGNKNTTEHNIEDIHNITDLTNTDKRQDLKMEEILKQLRIPEAVKDLPTFNGNIRQLQPFIKNVELILKTLVPIKESPEAKIILNAIRNKIVGEANDVLDRYSTELTWDEIKANLLQHYSDKRNESSLIQDLCELIQGQDTVEVFHSKIIDMYSILTNHAQANIQDETEKKIKTEFYKQMCLSRFLNGLKEPLGGSIRAREPKTLVDAYNKCLEEQNAYYRKHSNTIRNYQKPYFGQQYYQRPQAYMNPQTIQTQQFRQPNPSFQRSQAPAQSRPYIQNQQMFGQKNYPYNQQTGPRPFNQQNNVQPIQMKNQMQNQNYNTAKIYNNEHVYAIQKDDENQQETNIQELIDEPMAEQLINPDLWQGDEYENQMENENF